MKLKKGLFALVTAFALAFAAGAPSALVTGGLTFSIACGDIFDPPRPDLGSHYHSDTGGTLGSTPGKAEVGGHNGEEIRGLTEFKLIGMSSVSLAFVTFHVFRQGGLFPDPVSPTGGNATPFTGTILVDAYIGNNSEKGNAGTLDFEGVFGDYQTLSVGAVGSLDVAGGATPSPNLVGTKGIAWSDRIDSDSTLFHEMRSWRNLLPGG